MSDEKFKEYAENLIEIAKDDLDVSKILYDKNYYAFAIYHLQQAAEKAVKAYFVKSGINPKNLKKIGHEPISPQYLATFYKYLIAINSIITFNEILYDQGEKEFKNSEFYQNYFLKFKGKKIILQHVYYSE